MGQEVAPKKGEIFCKGDNNVLSSVSFEPVLLGYVALRTDAQRDQRQTNKNQLP